VPITTGMPLLRRLAALCVAYAIALQAIVAGFVTPRLDAAYPGLAFSVDAPAVICAGSPDQPAPVERHDNCVLCVMPGGCAGHALLDHGAAAVVPTPAISVAAAPAAPAPTRAFARGNRSHAARAPPAA